MKTITVSVPDEIYRQARGIAAKRGCSVSALVAEYLERLAGEDSEFRRLEALERRVISELTAFSASDRLPREQLYDRSAR